MSFMLSSKVSTSAVRPVSARGRRVVVRADNDQKSFNLDNSRQAGVGYMEKDSAGQTNIFPSVMGAYEQGSAADTAANSGANALYAAGAAVLAGGLVAVGVVSGLGADNSTPNAVDFSVELAQYSPISAYAAQFTADLAAPPPAPSPVADEAF